MLEEIRNERLKKKKRLEEAGVNPYSPVAKRTHTAKDAREGFTVLIRSQKKISLAGRVVAVRDQGGVIFLDLEDESGRFQGVLKKKVLKDFSLIKQTLDQGDFVEASGKVFKTKKGEKSLDVTAFRFLSKSVRPLPSEWYGLQDVEAKLRKRYIDLALNPEVREMFRKKAVFWGAFRDILKEEGFLEVELPVLEAVPGGAEAEPFTTHHNALDSDFYLRISLELPLKKLIVGGFEKVFEIGRIFRNEGIGREHLQDYTQLEFYWAYRDYNDLMKFVEKTYKRVIKKTTGGFVTSWSGKKINWGKKWAVVDYVPTFKKATGLDPLTASLDDLHKKAKELKLETDSSMREGRLIDLIFKKTVRQTLVQPSFLIDPPAAIEPLAKRSRKDPRRVERFQIVACGSELGKGFTELNDPIDQRERFEAQMSLREVGDKEAQQLDEDFLEALEYGMPPTAGFGISERLFAILMDKPIRETVVFPLMRPKEEQDS
ncbi:MAG: lysine--tRNA ligase [Patescibacteria group bacterium]